ncbi:MAG: hypothetical protein ABIK45_11650, partial [Pseudomonadota bacterium]
MKKDMACWSCCPWPDNSSEVEAICSEAPEALAHPRQLARFLCGLSSPAVSRARLARHPRFGCFADVPFQDVLAF